MSTRLYNAKDGTKIGGIDFLLHASREYLVSCRQTTVYLLLQQHYTRTPEAKKDYRGTKKLLLCFVKRHNASHPLKTECMEVY